MRGFKCWFGSVLERRNPMELRSLTEHLLIVQKNPLILPGSASLELAGFRNTFDSSGLNNASRPGQRVWPAWPGRPCLAYQATFPIGKVLGACSFEIENRLNWARNLSRE